MSETRVKCILAKYDDTITEAPFKTIKIDEFEVNVPSEDDGGVILAGRLHMACANKGYTMQFYTSSDVEGYTYEVVIYDEDYQEKMMRKQFERLFGSLD